VRPRTDATQRLIGQPLRAQDLQTARQSFDPAPGGRLAVSVTVTYLERCEQHEADLVFRTLRFRFPHTFGFVPAADLAKSWGRGGIDWHKDWGRVSLGYSANYTTQSFRQTGMFSVHSQWVEARATAGHGSASARVMALGPALWQRQLLPAALRNEPELKTQLSGALASAESLLRIEEYARDPAFQRIASRLEALERNGACLPASFKRRLRSARQATGGKQYGLVEALLANTAAPECESAARAAMQADFARIDKATAAGRAASQIAELRDLADRLLYRTPLVAVRPVALIEAVVSPKRRALPGLGGGLRVSLLNWLEVTGGYSNRTPFVELRFRDPLQ
jgi:hypothetical protein